MTHPSLLPCGALMFFQGGQIRVFSSGEPVALRKSLQHAKFSGANEALALQHVSH